MPITVGGKPGTWGRLFLHHPALLPYPGPTSPMHLPSASLASSTGLQEGRRWDRCSSLSQSPSWSSWRAETHPCGPLPQHRALRVRNLPCLFTKCCFISCLSEVASQVVKMLKRRRECRSVVPGMGRGCRWKEPELEEEERCLVVKMSHGGMR